MATAIVGLLGVIIGLAVGRGYTFWSTRRSELAEAVVASATLADELRRLRASIGPQDSEWTVLQARVEEVWRERSQWLLLHMGPTRFETLADWVRARDDSEIAPFGLDGVISTFAALARLFWEEHEAFMLIPLVHYVTGNTVSKRIEEIFDRDTSDVPPRRRGRLERSIKPWHSPRTLDDPPHSR